MTNNIPATRGSMDSVNISMEVIIEKLINIAIRLDNFECRIKNLEDQRALITVDLSVIKVKLNIIGTIALIILGSIVVLIFQLITHSNPALLP
jgi:hypothetical protein